MVCVDGFVLTHAFEPIDVPTQQQVDSYLPPFKPRQVLDPANPLSIGAMVGPEAFTEVRYLSDLQLRDAMDEFDELAAGLQDLTGRPLSQWEFYGPEDAETVVVAMGSVAGTLKDAADELAGRGLGSVAVLTLTMFRPFPVRAIAAALGRARRVLVLERALAPGADGPVSSDVRGCLSPGQSLSTVFAGLGGRAVTTASLVCTLTRFVRDELEPRSFLDLNHDIVDSELARREQQHQSGPHALNVLRDTGVPASRIG
jgi:pyruvate ferredoxin oxidoreductase alpha subunit